LDEVKSILTPVKEAAIQKNLDAGKTVEKQETFSISKEKSFEIKDEESLVQNAEFFAKHVRALSQKDASKLAEMNEYVQELRTKAGYNNTGVSTEGGYLVALPLFESQVERLLPQYGKMMPYINWVDVPGNTVYTNKGSNFIEFGKVAEAGVKPARKLTYTQQTTSLNKYAAIALASEELLQDQAVDFWQDARDSFAFGYGKRIDEMVLTDNDTLATQKGILHTSGVTYEPVSSPTGVTWDDLLNMKYRIPAQANTDNALYVMHRSTWNALLQLKGVSNDYLQAGTFRDANGNPTTPWGDTVLLSDAMPDTSLANWNGTGNGGGVVYGDFQRYAKVYRKAPGLMFKTSDSATVTDASGSTINLWQQNVLGLLGEFRATAFFKFPEAFAVAAQTNIS